MQGILTVYDDRQMPDSAVRQITGEKSYGSIIYKRKRLSDRVREAARGPFIVLDKGGLPEIKPEWRSLRVLHIFSYAVIENIREYDILRRKIEYANADYQIRSGHTVAALVFKDEAEWETLLDRLPSCDELTSGAESFKEIDCEAFEVISGRDEFLRFITGGFEARFFNSVGGDEYEVVKSSSNKAKIKAEYDFYRLLPDRMKSFFVMPYDYSENEDGASYRMERINAPDLAIRYVHGSIDRKQFDTVLKKLFHFLKIREKRTVDAEKFLNTRRSLYKDKPIERIREFEEMKGADKINALIAAGTDYAGVRDILDDYLNICEKEILKADCETVETIGHGDLCFSNILYQEDAALIRLIDPKGAGSEAEMYTDPLYDVAKLSHSICGNYDLINSDLYDIHVETDMRFKLRVDGDNTEYMEVFGAYLQEAGMDFKTVRLMECSLFLSMLPMHMDRPRKVTAFILNAIDILQSLKA